MVLGLLFFQTQFELDLPKIFLVPGGDPTENTKRIRIAANHLDS